MELLDFFYIIIIAFITATITGVTGVAGGLLPAIFLTPIVGITSIMPILAVMLLIGSFSRSWINRFDFHKEAFFRVAVPAIPMVIVGSFVYAQLKPNMIALMLGTIVLTSIPLRRLAKSHAIKTSPFVLSCVGGLFGFLAGTATGPGMLLIPFMLGFGLSRTNFVATLAVIAGLTHVARMATYGGLGLISQEILIIGLLAGVATIPGNIVGRKFLNRMTNSNFEVLVDIMAFGGAINFIWLGLK